MAAVVQLELHPPAERLDFLTQRFVLNHQEFPWLGADRAGRKAGKFQNRCKIFLADFFVGIVITGGAAIFEYLQHLFACNLIHLVFLINEDVILTVLPISGLRELEKETG